MRKINILFLFFVWFSFLHSYWEWTPQTKRWINPKYAVKDTPEEQFNYAEDFRKKGEIDKAIREHRKLLKYYPKSEFAPKSCFILGEIFKEKGDDKRAFDYFQRIIDQYPSSPLVFSAIKNQSEIAERQLKSKSNKFFNIFKKEEKGEFMNKVIENSPYDKEASERMFKLAKFYYDIKEYDKSIEVLGKIIKNFPQTDYEREAKYLKIKYLTNSISEVSCDTDEIEEIRDLVFEFKFQYPQNSDEIEKIEKSLNEKEAEKYYQIARYYERAGKKKSAIYYYKKIIEKFPETEYGKIASEKINRGL